MQLMLTGLLVSRLAVWHCLRLFCCQILKAGVEGSARSRGFKDGYWLIASWSFGGAVASGTDI